MNVKEAVGIAMDYVSSFDAVFPTRGLRLEETEIGEDGNWAVTLSFIDSDSALLDLRDTRVFKRFVIDPKGREVISMKIRNPLAA